MLKYAGGEIQVVSVSEYPWGFNTQAIALADGGWLLTWESRQQRFDQNGNKVGDEVELEGVGYVTAALSDGGWVTGLSDYLTTGSAHTDTYVGHYGSNGEAIFTGVRANTFTTGVQSVTCVQGLADGGWIVTWQGSGQDNHSDSDDEVYQQRYDHAGNAVGQNQRVNTYTLFEQGGARVSGLADGGWVVIWTSAHQDDHGSGVYLQRYDSLGNAIGGEERVNEDAHDSQVAPSTAALADGGWLVTWQNDSYKEIFQQRFAADGSRLGAQVALEFEYSVGAPQVDALPDGGWVMTYFSSEELRARVFNADGEPLGREIVVDSGFGYTSRSRTVSVLDDGRFVVAWSYEINLDQTEIRQRVFSVVENVGPVAADENYRMDERATLIVNVLNNDIDADHGERLSLETAVVTSGNAEITFSADGDITILDKSHQLIAGQKATVAIEYTVSDGFETDTGLATIEVNGLTNESDQVRGTAKADRYTGFNFDDFYFGLGGNDVIRGRGGDDFLVGGSGRDRINAGDGYNTIVGGTGDDHLSGASDVDVFVFSPGDGRDVVVVNGGGRNSTDVLDLSAFGFRNFKQLKRMVETDGWNLIIDLPGSDQIKIVDGNFYGVNAIV